jgi:hypothetical protein
MENSLTDKSRESGGFYTQGVHSLELAKKKLRLIFLEFLILIHMPENNNELYEILHLTFKTEENLFMKTTYSIEIRCKIIYLYYLLYCCLPIQYTLITTLIF